MGLGSHVIDDDAENDEAPAFISQQCKPGCRCMHMTLAEIRDNCSEPWIHQLLAYISKYKMFTFYYQIT